MELLRASGEAGDGITRQLVCRQGNSRHGRGRVRCRSGRLAAWLPRLGTPASTVNVNLFVYQATLAKSAILVHISQLPGGELLP